MQCRLKEIRMQKGMTRLELAEKTGISENLISELEDETVNEIHSKVLLRLAKALDTTLECIFLSDMFN